MLHALAKWLKPDGILLPDKATLFICGIKDRQYMDEKINWWDDVSGFDMNSIRCEKLCSVFSMKLHARNYRDLDFKS